MTKNIQNSLMNLLVYSEVQKIPFLNLKQNQINLS